LRSASCCVGTTCVVAVGVVHIVVDFVSSIGHIALIGWSAVIVVDIVSWIRHSTLACGRVVVALLRDVWWHRRCVVAASHHYRPHTSSYRGVVRVTLVVAPAVGVGVAAVRSNYVVNVCPWAAEVVVATVVAVVDSEVPAEATVIHWMIEVLGALEQAILHGAEDVLEVDAEVVPVHCAYCGRCDKGEIVEIHLIHRLILHFSQVEFVSHLVCDEGCVLMCQLVAHAFGG